MRKHDARKWLHAVLDLLPVLLIPVFMIYSHRHDVAQDFEVVEEVPIYYETNEVTTTNDLIENRVYTWADNYENQGTIEANLNFFYIKILSGTYKNSEGYFRLVTNGNAYVYITSNIYVSYEPFDFLLIQRSQEQDIAQMPAYFLNKLSICNVQYISGYQEVITTIPHDVMTSFMDRFNNTISQYFNMGNIFNMNNVYQWFETNIFGGTAPTVIYSVWNIVLYEFVMDLLFLLYGLFMWFIDMCTRLMEKPLNSIK